MDPLHRRVALGLWAQEALGHSTLSAALELGLAHSLEGRLTLAELRRFPARGRASLERARTQPLQHWAQAGDAVLELLQPLQAQTLLLHEPGYPHILAASPFAPPILTFQGDINAFARRDCVAVVGTRRASAGGLERCRTLTQRLVQRGLGVVSGGARGIDAAAHTSALAHNGFTAVVCGTGLDVVYPRTHQPLFAEIVASGGVVLSTYPPGTPGRSGNFPRRNQVIAGLACMTLVVEAPSHSGALYTAKASRRCLRPVWVVAGEAFSPTSEGSHAWVQSGDARLMHRVDDLFAEPRPLAEPPRLFPPAKPTPEPPHEGLERLILQALEGQTLTRDALMSVVGDEGEVSCALLTLELDGWVKRLPGERFSRATPA